MHHECVSVSMFVLAFDNLTYFCNVMYFLFWYNSNLVIIFANLFVTCLSVNFYDWSGEIMRQVNGKFTPRSVLITFEFNFKFTLLFTFYRQISNLRCTKSQNVNISRFALQLSLPNPLKPCVGSKMEMYVEQRRRRCSNYIWVTNNFIA